LELFCFFACSPSSDTTHPTHSAMQFCVQCDHACNFVFGALAKVIVKYRYFFKLDHQCKSAQQGLELYCCHGVFCCWSLFSTMRRKTTITNQQPTAFVSCEVAQAVRKNQHSTHSLYLKAMFFLTISVDSFCGICDTKSQLLNIWLVILIGLSVRDWKMPLFECTVHPWINKLLRSLCQPWKMTWAIDNRRALETQIIIFERTDSPFPETKIGRNQSNKNLSFAVQMMGIRKAHKHWQCGAQIVHSQHTQHVRTQGASSNLLARWIANSKIL